MKNNIKRSKEIHIWYRDCETESGWPGFLPTVYWDLCMLHTYLRLTQRTSIPSISSMNLLLTETRASCGQAWNQSIAVQLTMAGNFRALTRSVWPTGEKQKTICREQGEGRTGQKQQRDVCARQYTEISDNEGGGEARHTSQLLQTRPLVQGSIDFQGGIATGQTEVQLYFPQNGAPLLSSMAHDSLWEWDFIMK